MLGHVDTLRLTTQTDMSIIRTRADAMDRTASSVDEIAMPKSDTCSFLPRRTTRTEINVSDSAKQRLQRLEMPDSRTPRVFKKDGDAARKAFVNQRGHPSYHTVGSIDALFEGAGEPTKTSDEFVRVA